VAGVYVPHSGPRGPIKRLATRGERVYGRLVARPVHVDPLAEFGPVARRLRRLRLKEWIGFTLLHPEWAASLIVQDAHYLASSEIYAAHRTDGTRHEHSAAARGGSLRLPAVLQGQVGIRRPGHVITYTFAAPGSRMHTIRIDIAATATAPAFQGTLTLDAVGASAPLSVSSRLPRGSGAGRSTSRMYTHKALYPVEGVLRVGRREIVFDPGRDLAVLDEHRSLLPYRTRWLWGTFALAAAHGPVGANFADRVELPGEEGEGAIWAATPDGARCEALDAVDFDPGEGDSPWHIASADGRLSTVFTPQGRKDVDVQLGVAAMSYTQMYGRYDGLLHAGGRGYVIDGVPGVCEAMDARL
jgi:hypothetical protein